MIKCPVTGREIPTGIEADRSSFNSAPVFFSRTFCPICRTYHEWYAQEAWVRETRPAAGRRAAAGRSNDTPSSLLIE